MTQRESFFKPSSVDGVRCVPDSAVFELSTGEFDSPTAVVEEYYDRVFSGVRKQRELTHSAVYRGAPEFTLLDTQVVTEGLGKEELSERTFLERETIETILAGGTVALVEATTEREVPSGAVDEETQTWAVGSEDGTWRLVTEQVGDEESIAPALTVVGQAGLVGPDSTITELRFAVAPDGDVDELDLTALTLQYVSDDAFANLVVGRVDGEKPTGETAPDAIELGDDGGQYLLGAITADDESNSVMTEQTDRYRIRVPLGGSQETLEPLNGGDSVEITVTTEPGTQTVAFFEIPASLEEYDEGDTIEL